MSWFSKKKEVDDMQAPLLPELPEPKDFNFPSKQRFQEDSNKLPIIEINELPALPNSETGRKFNQETIKNAINKPEEQGFQESRFPARKFNENKLPEFPQKRTIELSPSMASSFNKQMAKKAEPVFIRLDKFQLTLDSFEQIKNKISEIESLLRKIKEVKSKEDEELTAWEREIQIIKSRIDSIDKNMFSNIN
jgi:hypothetical protein